MPRLSRNRQLSLFPIERMSLTDDSVVSFKPDDRSGSQSGLVFFGPNSQPSGSLALSSLSLVSFRPSMPGLTAGVSSLFA